MKFKIDENVPTGAVEVFRTQGHECHTVFDKTLGGAADSQIADKCRSEGLVLVTLDLDFADIRTYPPAQHAGIVVLRPSEPDRDRVLALIARTLTFCEQESVIRSLWIVDEGQIRIRR